MSEQSRPEIAALVGEAKAGMLRHRQSIGDVSRKEQEAATAVAEAALYHLLLIEEALSPVAREAGCAAAVPALADGPQGCICPQDGSTCWTCNGTPSRYCQGYADAKNTPPEAQGADLRAWVQHWAHCELSYIPGGVVERDTPEERPAHCTCGLSTALAQSVAPRTPQVQEQKDDTRVDTMGEGHDSPTAMEKRS